jgi:hypothetical protein
MKLIKYLLSSIILLNTASCSTNNKAIDIRRFKAYEVGELGANYKILSRVQGKGCVKLGLFGKFFNEPEKESYVSAIPHTISPKEQAKSIAMYNATESVPDADVFIHTTTIYTTTDEKVCADVKAVAGKLVRIGDAKL